MTVISQGAALFRTSEEEEADRLHAAYGLQRACQVAEVLEGRTTPKPLRAFWWRVGYLLSQRNNDPAPAPKKEHDGHRKPIEGRLTVTVTTVDGPKRLTRAEFRVLAAAWEASRATSPSGRN